MKLEHIDWKVLRGAIIILTLCALVGGSLIGGSYYFQKKMNEEFRRNNSQFKSISGRYLAVDEEEKLIKKYYPEFVRLYEGGIIGREERLNWIEVLRKAGDKIKIPALSYQVDSQKVYKPDFKIRLDKYKLYASEMSLNMQLLHEGDLFNLLNILTEKAKGTYRIRSCQMTSSEIIMDKPEAGNINMQCQLEWFTLNLANGKEIQI